MMGILKCSVECISRRADSVSLRNSVQFENTPMGDELKWLLKEGGGRIYESCDILSKIRPPHTQLV